MSSADASWVEGAEGSGYGLAHLPYGVFSVGEEPRRVGVAIGGRVLDLAEVGRSGRFGADVADPVGLFARDRLNPFLAAGPAVWSAVRARLVELLGPDGDLSLPLVPRERARLHLPFAVADYVDFYSSLDHATTVGRLFRPDGDPLPRNWRHLPVGYHGRSGTVVVSGTQVRRPLGQRGPGDFGPSQRLDFELEVGWVVGRPSPQGETVPIDRAGEHLFGLALVNDWSARDLQLWESQPLGPFLAKSFATSLAPWVTPLQALEPFRVRPPRQDPPVLPYLRTERAWGFDLDLEVALNGKTSSRVNFSRMYWTVAQQLAHLTVNGASLRTGDLLASGTVSGPDPASAGSLLERGGDFLADGDEVVLRGSAGGEGTPLLHLGEVRGTVSPASAPR
jgi:fumarylacetoacetase